MRISDSCAISHALFPDFRGFWPEHWKEKEKKSLSKDWPSFYSDLSLYLVQWLNKAPIEYVTSICKIKFSKLVSY